MNGSQKFRQYMQIIPPDEHITWLFATLGNVHDELDRMKKEITKLKAHNTRLKKKQK